MKLALAMGRTLQELSETMTSQEFGLWAALYSEDPWDTIRQDINTGIIAAAIANSAGKIIPKGKPPAKPADYMPFLKQREQEQDAVNPLEYFGKF